MQLTSQQITNIKWLALLTMLVDHIGYTFEFHPIINAICRLIGRFAFIAFVFLIVYQIHFSQGGVIRKYIKRLSFFLIISQLPYIAFTGEYHLNIFGQLLAIVLFILGVRQNNVFIVVGGIILAICSSYGATGLLLGIAFYAYFQARESMVSENQKRAFYAFAIGMGGVVTHFFWQTELYALCFAVMGGLTTFGLINSKRLMPEWKLPNINKWYFYAFYPAHISILAILFYLSL